WTGGNDAALSAANQHALHAISVKRHERRATNWGLRPTANTREPAPPLLLARQRLGDRSRDRRDRKHPSDNPQASASLCMHGFPPLTAVQQISKYCRLRAPRNHHHKQEPPPDGQYQFRQRRSFSLHKSSP